MSLKFTAEGSEVARRLSEGEREARFRKQPASVIFGVPSSFSVSPCASSDPSVVVRLRFRFSTSTRVGMQTPGSLEGSRVSDRTSAGPHLNFAYQQVWKNGRGRGRA